MKRERAGRASSASRSVRDSSRVPRRCNLAISTLNRLATARCRPGVSTTRVASPTPAQAASRNRVAQAARRYGVPSGWTPAEAFAEVVKSKDIYSLEQCTVRPFDRSKLKLLKRGISPAPLRPRLPSDSQAVLDSLWTTVVRPAQEVEMLLESGEASPVTPYWDTVLRTDREQRVCLIRELAEVGLVCFQLRLYCRAALFFVEKKGDQIRMIVDGGEASLFCRRPPYTPLGSAGAWAEIGFSDESLLAAARMSVKNE